MNSWQKVVFENAESSSAIQKLQALHQRVKRSVIETVLLWVYNLPMAGLLRLQ